jgi:hypothetical protein
MLVRFVLAILFCVPAMASDLLIRDVTLIDGTGSPAQPHMDVLISGERITAIEPTSPKRRTPGHPTVLDGRGKFLIPGLWDTHVHLVDVGELAVPLYPANGITSVRDMGGNVAPLMALRKKVESGQVLGPRMKICGPMLEGKWEQKPGGRTDHWAVATAEDAQKTIDLLASQGVDCIKVRSYASPESYEALIAAARRHGLPLGGHPPYGIDPLKGAAMGQSSFEHAFYPYPWDKLSPDEKAGLAKVFRESQVALVPTVVAWESFLIPLKELDAGVADVAAKSDPRLRQVSPSLRTNWIDSAKDIRQMKGDEKNGLGGWIRAIDENNRATRYLHDQGVTIMAGTDTGVAMVFPASALHQELKYLVSKVGLTPLEALQAATMVPAKYFKMEKELGTIEAGKTADLVLLAADPLQDISNTQLIDGVVLRGHWLSKNKIEETKKQVEDRIAKIPQPVPSTAPPPARNP